MVSALDSASSGPGSSPGALDRSTLTRALSIQVYKWVPANLMLGGGGRGGNPAMDYHPIQGGGEILLVSSC